MRRDQGPLGLFHVGGWLFADLMLAMVVLFLAASSFARPAAGTAPSPTTVALGATTPAPAAATPAPAATTLTATRTPLPAATPTQTPVATLPAVAMTGTATPASARTTAPLGAPRYGITADPADPRQLEAVRAAGGRLVTLAVSWREVEPSPSSPERFNWAKYDALFTAAGAAGLTPFVIVTGNPTWAWAPGPNGIIAPAALPDFAEFVEALVARYRGYTSYWSFYNEPDCNGSVTSDIHASCWGNHGSAYAEMLKAVYPAVKRADADGRVLFGGIAFDNFQADRAFARQFLDDALAAGAGDAIDAFNFHYYPGFRSNWERYGTDVIGKATFLRTILSRYNVDKPLILTEIGLGTRGPGESDELQAHYVVQAHVRAFAAGIESIFWYDLIDPGPAGFGLLAPDYRPRLAQAAYRTLIDQVGNRPFTRSIGAAELGTPGVEAYEFGGPAGRLVVIWSTDDTTRRVRVAAPGGRQIDLTGAVSLLAGSGGTIELPVGPRPVYLDLR